MDATHDPAGYRQLRRFLHVWSLTAIAAARPGYYEELAAARAGRATTVPVSPPGPGAGGPPGWRPVGKRRRISRFPRAGGQITARGPGPGGQPGCAVELTQIRTGGQDWWTLGFEATGPAGLLRGTLAAAAALVFAQALPGGMQPGPDQSRSYAQWPGRPPGAGRRALMPEERRGIGIPGVV